MSNQHVLTEIDRRGVASLTLNRPEVHNAFDDALIAQLNDALADLSGNDDVRVLKILGHGKSFSAGADLNWMKRMAGYSHDENLEDANKVAHMWQALSSFPRPTLAVVHGNAFGGGIGLIACCDIAVASDNARFSLSEVKLGLIPATIGPFVVEAIGARQARRLFVSAERFDAVTAMRLGLVHEVVSAELLDDTVEAFVSRLIENGPDAMAASKRLVAAVVNRPIDEQVLADVAERIALQRATEEGREGVAAFLEKRPPSWIRD